MITEFDICLDAQDDWRALHRQIPSLFGREIGDAVREHVERNGLLDPLSGPVAGSEVRIDGDNYRETVVAHGINARQRAVLLSLQDALDYRDGGFAIYASEAVSPLAMRLMEHVPGFVGSEYLPTEEDRQAHPEVIHQNVLALSFADASHDAYISCDVLEHVPDLDATLREAARILKPGGAFIGTVPFAAGRYDTIVKARLERGRIEYDGEPEFHGNPTRPGEGSLVFQIPGWDLLDRMRDAGFASAQIRLSLSQRYGVFGTQTAFLSSFVATKRR
ncbi:MAG: class I SAM-dependent methyltransferase [Pseudomonadota bacterium]